MKTLSLALLLAFSACSLPQSKEAGVDETPAGAVELADEAAEGGGPNAQGRKTDGFEGGKEPDHVRHEPSPVAKRRDAATQCNADADCVVKNVGNCCGYFPACVNTAHEPDPEGVQEECRRKGMASICGFAEIAQCRCVAKQCEAVAGDSVQ